MTVLAILTLACQSLGDFNGFLSAQFLDMHARNERDHKNFERAVSLHRQAHALQPGNVVYARQLSLSLLAAGRAVEVLPALNSPKPGDVESIKILAEACLEINRPQSVIPQLQAISGMDQDGSIHLLLGRAYQLLHQPTPAGLALRQAEKLRKNFKPN